MYQIQLVKSELVASKTLLLQFNRPAKYHFEPGQYAYLTLVTKKYPDYDHHSRILSFASSPSDPTLDFLVRLGQSGFKRELVELQIGDLVSIGNPIGSFYFDPNNAPAVYLAGGIGIAPFMSIAKSTGDFMPNTSLIWSNQTELTTPLFSVILSLCRQKKLRFYPLLTRLKHPEPPFVAGRITEDWLTLHHLIIPEATYLICGSTGFVDEISTILTESGIELNHIKQEAFTGYV